MTALCLVCANGYQGATHGYHPSCLRDLFSVDSVPDLDVDLARLHTLALAMVGRASLSGVQRKLSVRLDDARSTLQVATERGQYVLKPQAGTFPHLPENEWVTQRLAALIGIEVPPCGLVALRDGSLAYIVKRFDRTEDGGKLAMEDFCQLAELPPGGKYDGSAERCATLVRRHTDAPLLELLRLFRQFVFAWWVGNGDMHLKNLALLHTNDGWQLAPAYDQLCTRLVIPDDSLAMPMCGKRDNVKRAAFLELGQRFGIGDKAVVRVIEEVGAVLPEAIAIVQSAPLPESMREDYVALLRSRVL